MHSNAVTTPDQAWQHHVITPRPTWPTVVKIRPCDRIQLQSNQNNSDNKLGMENQCKKTSASVYSGILSIYKTQLVIENNA